MKHSFFRSIRQTLFNEGKLLRYMGYAIGEVLLIIVGILFALKINDWNEDRKAQVEFDEYVVQLREDVRTAVESLAAQQESLEIRVIQSHSVIKYLQGDRSEIEGIEVFERRFNRLGRTETPEVYVGVLGALLNGNFAMVSRDKMLAQRALNLQSKVKQHLESIGRIDGWISSDNAILDKYRARAPERFVQMSFRYDLDKISNSEEFMLAAQNVIARTSSIARFTGFIQVNLESFLTVLEEYE